MFYHIAGLLGQRLWFYNKTRSYTDKLHIDPNACICCGKCVRLCPMKNISIIDNRVQAHDQCTMCYRCINQCPQRAITLIGKEVIEQHRVEDFL
ncbi:MAG: 4Fe-4S dicluster domain-containing protein [bacterium]|nr:4Fe-4S dicluster domain-containing protein [bacterium]